MRTVTAALARAEAVRDQWFPRYEIPDCVIEEIDPVEAGNAPLAYYRPPAGGGLRPGAFCVLTAMPGQRFGYEYEALSFHESTPGHHLQIASAQTQPLPAYRRFLDAEVCGYVEGWGLYCERLADEIDRYIGWPGQALAYLTGRREIQRLRGLAERALGPRFDIRAFHGTVLGSGAVPLGVLEQLVTRWVEAEQG